MQGLIHRFSFEVPSAHARYKGVARLPSKLCLVHWKGRTSHACSATVGIDLGTSNSSVAAVVDGLPTPIPLQNGEFTMPSVVAFTEVE